jgi:hypothetical protein
MVIVLIAVVELRLHTLDLGYMIFVVCEGMRIRWKHSASSPAKRRS